MSKVLVRKQADGTEAECWVIEDGFWWVQRLAESQGIQFQEYPWPEAGYTCLKLCDAEAARFVSLLEFTVNDVLEPMLKETAEQEQIDSLIRWKSAAAHVAEFTRGGGWEVLV